MTTQNHNTYPYLYFFLLDVCNQDTTEELTGGFRYNASEINVGRQSTSGLPGSRKLLDVPAEDELGPSVSQVGLGSGGPQFYLDVEQLGLICKSMVNAVKVPSSSFGKK